jgi:hypothetical protein
VGEKEDGIEVGELEGERVGSLEGKGVGSLEGKGVGSLEGKGVGSLEGKGVGSLDEGCDDGENVGTKEGVVDGLAVVNFAKQMVHEGSPV